MLADLCFADLLLFVPVADGDAAAAASSCSARSGPPPARRCYRDDLVGHVVDEAERPAGRPAWRARRDRRGRDRRRRPAASGRGVQCIPVRCDGQLVAVLTREAALDGRPPPGELERVYVEVFDRFARMIVAGRLPVRRRRRRHRGGAARRRRRDAARRRPARVDVRVAQRRQRAAPHGRPRQHRGARARRARHRRRGGAHGFASGVAGHRGARTAQRRHRAGALHPAARPRRGHRRAGAAARRHRPAPPRPAAAVQGRRHPRGPPPRQEQPADDLVAAAAAGPAPRAGPGAQWRSRRRSAASAPSPSCTRSCPSEAGRGGAPSTRSCRRWCAWPRTACSPERPVRVQGQRRRRRAARRRGHAARRRAQRAAAERRRARLPRRRGAVRAARSRSSSLAQRRRASTCGWSTTASGCRPSSTIDRSTSLGLSIVRDLVQSQLARAAST